MGLSYAAAPRALSLPGEKSGRSTVAHDGLVQLTTQGRASAEDGEGLLSAALAGVTTPSGCGGDLG